jgi:hypothetical protein
MHNTFTSSEEAAKSGKQKNLHRIWQGFEIHTLGMGGQ